ncbi:hypothetical protein ACFL1U_03525 [Patescibacteria group bacterium]
MPETLSKNPEKEPGLEITAQDISISKGETSDDLYEFSDQIMKDIIESGEESGETTISRGDAQKLGDLIVLKKKLKEKKEKHEEGSVGDSEMLKIDYDLTKAIYDTEVVKSELYPNMAKYFEEKRKGVSMKEKITLPDPKIFTKQAAASEEAVKPALKELQGKRKNIKTKVVELTHRGKVDEALDLFEHQLDNGPTESDKLKAQYLAFLEASEDIIPGEIDIIKSKLEQTG